MKQEEETNDNSFPKSSQKPKARNLNKASKDVTKRKQKCKTKANDKTKCFLSFWILWKEELEELEETKKTIQLPSQTTLNFKQNFKNAPNLIGLPSSKIYMSKRRQETQ